MFHSNGLSENHIFSGVRVTRSLVLCLLLLKKKFQNLTLGYMTNTLNQIIIFFPPPKSEYFVQQHWESEYFFTITHSLNIK
jgi:hypothetical protein